MNSPAAIVSGKDSGSISSASSVEIPVVFVVDDDVSIRESLELLINSAGWSAKLFSTAEAFLAHTRCPVPSCLVLDVGLPALNGLDLQDRIADWQTLPIIFITGCGDIPMSVRAIKAGAVEFLTKPLTAEVLLSALHGAIERSRMLLVEESKLRVLSDRLESLTNRERQVMALVVRGQLNKQIAYELHLSEVTVKVHRGRVMRKMAARSLAELVNLAARLGVYPT